MCVMTTMANHRPCDNITNLSFRYMQTCLHLFMQSFTDSVFLALYYYGVKSKKVTLSGQQRRKGVSKQKACCKSFFDPINPYFALIDKCQLFKLPDSF